jgi:hypothetical protein
MHIYFYSKINQMHKISNLFYFGTKLYMFRKVFPSVIRSLRLYIQHQVYVIQVLWLLASKQPQNLYDVCTVLDSWWWTERPSETCKVLFQNKTNLRYCASGWFYYRNRTTRCRIESCASVCVCMCVCVCVCLWKFVSVWRSVCICVSM